jgi:hypothetical protein
MTIPIRLEIDAWYLGVSITTSIAQWNGKTFLTIHNGEIIVVSDFVPELVLDRSQTPDIKAQINAILYQDKEN